MKRQDRRFPALCRAVFAAVLVLVLTGANLVPAAAVTWADVNDLKNEANSLDAEKKEPVSYTHLTLPTSDLV